MFSVRDKKIIVTGGANGIGYQCCYHFLKNGAKVVAILDLPKSNGESAVSKLEKEFGNGRAIFFPSDVTNKEFGVVFDKAFKTLGGLDILVNNAGILNDHEWIKEIEINFTSVVRNTLLAYDYMGKHKGGNGGIVVNLSSVVGLVKTPHLPVYCGTKHAVVGFTVCLKDHYAKTGISVRVMCPGVTDTPLITECRSKYLNFIDNDHATDEMMSFSRQPAEYIGKSMVEIIEKGQNGSVWVSQSCDPPFEVELPTFPEIVL